MINYPQYAQVKDKKYKINTDYKIALKCEEVAKSNVSEEERALAIIYLLFGNRGLKDSENWNNLLQIALKYLNCGKEPKEQDSQEEVNVDFEQDREFIRTSFFYDYKIRLTKNKYMHWWEFYSLLCGLSENSILNRVRFVRDYDISTIKDSKEKAKWIKQKDQVALKHKTKEKTEEQKRLDELFKQQLKGR